MASTDESTAPVHPASARRIAIVVNVDWFFLSHRLPLAEAARQRGHSVLVVAGDTGRGREIKEAGFDYMDLPLERQGTNPLTEVRTLTSLLCAYRRFRPTLVHQVTVKPILYGTIAAWLAGVPAVVNAITGLGRNFSIEGHTTLREKVFLSAYRAVLRLKEAEVIFQNPDDRYQFVKAGVVRHENSHVILGSGVDRARWFSASLESTAMASDVVFAGRMLWTKGVGEFVAAARMLRRRHPDTEFLLVGAPDEKDPSHVSTDQLEAWDREGTVRWLGYREDMPAILSRAAIVVLPSYYREGVPKILIEAAASGCSMVASDVPGCREIVRDGVTGLLVPPQDARALSGGIDRLLRNPRMRQQLGARARVLFEAKFTKSQVIRETLAVWDKSLA